MKFSIITPVYNVQAFLGECIDSVLNQTCDDFELLLVDDGSSDSSGLICDRYAGIDDRIKVFHRSNGGVSSARNLGLDKANGEWIVFLDADDMLHPMALEVLATHIDTWTDVDFIQNCHTESSLSLDEVVTVGNVTCLTAKEYCDSLLYNVCVWGGAYRNSVIREANIRFDEKLALAEDQVFVFQTMQASAKCLKLPHVLNYYRIHPGAVTKKVNIEAILNSIAALTLYKTQMPLALRQFDSQILSYLYDLTVKTDFPVGHLKGLMDKYPVNYADRTTRGVKLFYHLSRASKSFAVVSARLMYHIYHLRK